MALHACDVASDYALYKGCLLGARVMLVAPCCQHEINQQIDPLSFPLLLKHGLLQERFSALLTDAIRAALIENRGYRVQLLEFVDPIHTPKNLLIRAIFQGPKVEPHQLDTLFEKFGVKPMLATLLLGIGETR